MAVQTLEQQKQRYSRQLAAYTFRQWNAVKDAKLPEKKDQTGPMEPPHMKSNGTNLKDASSTCSNTRRDHDNKGIHAVDYARPSGRAARQNSHNTSERVSERNNGSKGNKGAV